MLHLLYITGTTWDAYLNMGSFNPQISPGLCVLICITILIFQMKKLSLSPDIICQVLQSYTHTHTHSEIQKPLHHGEASCAASNRRRRGGREDIWFCSHNCMPIYLKICSFFFLDFLLSYSFYLVCRRSHTLAHSASIPTLSGLSENFCTVFCRYSTCKWVHFYQFVALLQSLEAREGCQCIERLGYLARQ